MNHIHTDQIIKKNKIYLNLPSNCSVLDKKPTKRRFSFKTLLNIVIFLT